MGMRPTVDLGYGIYLNESFICDKLDEAVDYERLGGVLSRAVSDALDIQLTEHGSLPENSPVDISIECIADCDYVAAVFIKKTHHHTDWDDNGDVIDRGKFDVPSDADEILGKIRDVLGMSTDTPIGFLTIVNYY